MREKLREERHVRKEKNEEEFEVTAKNKDKELDMMISDGKEQKKEGKSIDENEKTRINRKEERKHDE